MEISERRGGEKGEKDWKLEISNPELGICGRVGFFNFTGLRKHAIVVPIS
ncbi:MAG: hypothetical protein AABY65_07165 [Nitrospirota bacterium]